MKKRTARLTGLTGFQERLNGSLVTLVEPLEGDSWVVEMDGATYEVSKWHLEEAGEGAE